jgi:hypothetical protein
MSHRALDIRGSNNVSGELGSRSKTMSVVEPWEGDEAALHVVDICNGTATWSVGGQMRWAVEGLVKASFCHNNLRRASFASARRRRRVVFLLTPAISSSFPVASWPQAGSGLLRLGNGPRRGAPPHPTSRCPAEKPTQRRRAAGKASPEPPKDRSGPRCRGMPC